MLSKENLYVYHCYVKNSFLVKKALGEMFDRNFHGGGNKFVLIFNSTICGGPFLCLCEVKV